MPTVTTRRKKPVEVRTLEWTGNNPEEMEAFVGLLPDCTGFGFAVEPDGTAMVWNDEERCWINVPVGHHIVAGPLDEFYPLSPAALELTYEPPEPVDRDELLRRSEEDGAKARLLDAEAGKERQ